MRIYCIYQLFLSLCVMISTSVLGSCSFMMLHTSIICCVSIWWQPSITLSYHNFTEFKILSQLREICFNPWTRCIGNQSRQMMKALWMVVIIWRFLLEIRNYFSGPFSNIFFRFWYTETYINPNDLICFYLLIRYMYYYHIKSQLREICFNPWTRCIGNQSRQMKKVFTRRTDHKIKYDTDHGGQTKWSMLGRTCKKTSHNSNTTNLIF
jgi:hypothetical protein